MSHVTNSRIVAWNTSPPTWTLQRYVMLGGIQNKKSFFLSLRAFFLIYSCSKLVLCVFALDGEQREGRLFRVRPQRLGCARLGFART